MRAVAGTVALAVGLLASPGLADSCPPTDVHSAVPFASAVFLGRATTLTELSVGDGHVLVGFEVEAVWKGFVFSRVLVEFRSGTAVPFQPGHEYLVLADRGSGPWFATDSCMPNVAATRADPLVIGLGVGRTPVPIVWVLGALTLLVSGLVVGLVRIVRGRRARVAPRGLR